MVHREDGRFWRCMVRMTSECSDSREDRKSCEGLTTVMKASEVLPRHVFPIYCEYWSYWLGHTWNLPPNVLMIMDILLATFLHQQFVLNSCSRPISPNSKKSYSLPTMGCRG